VLPPTAPSPGQAPPQSGVWRRGAFLAATSLTFLKPLFKRTLKPLVAHLARLGVMANQVTIASLVGSLVVGIFVATHADAAICFGLLSVWLVLRMCLATIDGTLAIDFGQKSRLGGILNEAGDIVSDTALILPFAFVPPFGSGEIAVVVALAVLSELAGIAGPALGGSRRIDGPFGKADRSLVFGALGIWIAGSGTLPAQAAVLPPAFALLSLVTIGNRLRFAAAEARAANLKATIGVQAPPEHADLP
jgi:CDP-diacylglycerol--glycerol-3-phosphate 3-phosphatidyltransferase